MTYLPQELILAVFDMYTNINDIINLAESNDYVFDIYKANIDKVIKQLINNNKQNSLVHTIISSGYYNTFYNNIIDTKLDIVKKIGNYLSNYTQEKYEEHLSLIKSHYANINKEIDSHQIISSNFS